MMKNKLYLNRILFIICAVFAAVVVFAFNNFFVNRTFKSYGDIMEDLVATTSVATQVQFRNLPENYNTPDSISVALLCNEVDCGMDTDLLKDAQYKYKWDNLPKYTIIDDRSTPSNATEVYTVYNAQTGEDIHYVENKYTVTVTSVLPDEFDLSYNIDEERNICEIVLRYNLAGDPHSTRVEVQKHIDYDLRNPKEGDKVSAFIIVHNPTSQEVSGIYIRSYIPKYAHFVSSDRGEYGYLNDREHVTWFIPNMSANETLNMNIEFSIDYCIGEELEWDCYAEILGDEEEPYFNTDIDPDTKF